MSRIGEIGFCALIILVLLLLIACGVRPSKSDLPENQSAQWTKIGDVLAVRGISVRGIYRYVDGKAGVACWLYLGDTMATWSCLPLDQTLLGR